MGLHSRYKAYWNTCNNCIYINMVMHWLPVPYMYPSPLYASLPKLGSVNLLASEQNGHNFEDVFRSKGLFKVSIGWGGGLVLNMQQAINWIHKDQDSWWHKTITRWKWIQWLCAKIVITPQLPQSCVNHQIDYALHQHCLVWETTSCEMPPLHWKSPHDGRFGCSLSQVWWIWLLLGCHLRGSAGEACVAECASQGGRVMCLLGQLQQDELSEAQDAHM